ncbi:peptidase M1 [Aquimarina sp. D1M17]|uniref:M1 family aminopeptidase n=1 Tax=Aquimarina acroporae TaxID=2937283 RepID=UPI0020C0470B|nr:M1 family aminopeptidase [Aquimarina acroporae]MCK8520168.1 peptidase M1 [Aquimarina acroporae]
MWYEILKFELKYRIKRPETYIFFMFLFLFSIVGVDFVFQGVEIGLVKKNAPIVIAKTMGAITGIFMIMVSMIMGVPVLRDFQYDMESLLFVNPIKKRDYILGRFLGSFIILTGIFSGVVLGMILGAQMPWHDPINMLDFNIMTYLQSFMVVVFPLLFFGACLFFVSGMLSRKLLVVYTQGIFLFVVFLLTKAIKNEYLQAILDPFSLTTLTQFTKDWSVVERNSLGITMTDVLLHNKLFWFAFGVVILFFGYKRFSFSLLRKKVKNKNRLGAESTEVSEEKIIVPKVNIHSNFKTHWNQFIGLSKFYTYSLFKETSFWAIVICGMIIILINSVNLGTVYGVNSYPTTYLIVEELQEMSLYFFMIILLFYSGELIWKERTSKIQLLCDSTSVLNVTVLCSKFFALVCIYVVLMLSLIASGIAFQIAKGYYQFELDVYFFGFFLEILPFLVLYTFITFFFQVLSNNKFVGIFLAIIFFMINIGAEALGFQHNLYKFAGNPLQRYSEMNGYGHFLSSFLWVKTYWLTFGILLLLMSSIWMLRGTEANLFQRWKIGRTQVSKLQINIMFGLVTVFMGIGAFIFYNTNMVNEYWSNTTEMAFRAQYEKKLKPFEYILQPKITEVNLNVELYPKERAYEAKGFYILKNMHNTPIKEVHIQKSIASHLQLDSINFEGGAHKNSDYQEFDYTIYQLSKPLRAGDSIKMSFKQSYVPKGFENHGENTEVLENGTFMNNQVFPTIGYNKKYELRDTDSRNTYGLKPRIDKADQEDEKELGNVISGGDSDGINYEIVIGTESNQLAISSGALLKEWKVNDRSYFHYKMNQPMLNFYAIVSGEYRVERDVWQSSSTLSAPVDLEIYHHPGHSYNLDRMMAAMKSSLEYYSDNFSPYQYQQLRIMEFPRYEEYAQSFPNAIPFSEAMGFVLDIDDEKDVDMVFFITAHEVAHQWFGMQVGAANVKGRHLVLETLSQYAALMVLKNKYSEEKVDQFLEFQKETYAREQKKSKTEEPALIKVENQDYVYYNKGALAMYALQQHIGEDKINLALRRFIDDWNMYNGTIKKQTQRYATSKDLLSYFRQVTPKELQYVVTDLFEKAESTKIP